MNEHELSKIMSRIDHTQPWRGRDSDNPLHQLHGRWDHQPRGNTLRSRFSQTIGWGYWRKGVRHTPWLQRRYDWELDTLHFQVLTPPLNSTSAQEGPKCFKYTHPYPCYSWSRMQTGSTCCKAAFCTMDIHFYFFSLSLAKYQDTDTIILCRSTPKNGDKKFTTQSTEQPRHTFHRHHSCSAIKRNLELHVNLQHHIAWNKRWLYANRELDLSMCVKRSSIQPGSVRWLPFADNPTGIAWDSAAAVENPLAFTVGDGVDHNHVNGWISRTTNLEGRSKHTYRHCTGLVSLSYGYWVLN